MRCLSCHRFFCRECATEHGGRLLCAQCLAASVVPTKNPGAQTLGATAGWIAAALAGSLFVWLVFFYLGAALVRAPFDFHTG